MERDEDRWLADRRRFEHVASRKGGAVAGDDARDFAIRTHMAPFANTKIRIRIGSGQACEYELSAL